MKKRKEEIKKSKKFLIFLVSFIILFLGILSFGLWEVFGVYAATTRFTGAEANINAGPGTQVKQGGLKVEGGMEVEKKITVDGKNVCLKDGTNCPKPNCPECSTCEACTAGAGFVRTGNSCARIDGDASNPVANTVLSFGGSVCQRMECNDRVQKIITSAEGTACGGGRVCRGAECLYRYRVVEGVRSDRANSWSCPITSCSPLFRTRCLTIPATCISGEPWCTARRELRTAGFLSRYIGPNQYQASYWGDSAGTVIYSTDGSLNGYITYAVFQNCEPYNANNRIVSGCVDNNANRFCNIYYRQLQSF